VAHRIQHLTDSVCRGKECRIAKQRLSNSPCKLFSIRIIKPPCPQQLIKTDFLINRAAEMRYQGYREGPAPVGSAARFARASHVTTCPSLTDTWRFDQLSLDSKLVRQAKRGRIPASPRCIR